MNSIFKILSRRYGKKSTVHLFRYQHQYQYQHQYHHPSYSGSLRSFARSSAPPPTSESKAKTFIISLGHEEKVAQGVIDALSASGLSGESLLSSIRTMAGRVEVGEDAGLEALIQSVKQDLSRSDGKEIIRFWCLPPFAWENHDTTKDAMKRSFAVDGYDGMTVTDVAKFGTLEGADTLSEYLECACSGIMACSTCHVIVDPPWLDQVGKPCEDEQDMIDLAYSPTDTSRLGCQIVLTPALDGLVLKLPRGANNIMDHIPFED